MKEWKEYEFQQVLVDESISYGIVQPGSHTETDFVPVIRVNNIKDGRINTDQILKVDRQIEKNYSRTRLEGGELLITVVGSVGECAIVPHSLKGWNVARAVSVARIKNDFDVRFIKYAFKTDDLIFQIYGNTNDTVQATLNLSLLKKLKLNLPPLPEQRAIAAILSSLDDKIDLLHRQNATLESMAEVLFRQWFVVEAGDWEERKLGDFISVKHGYAFKGSKITTEVTNYFLVTPGNFKIGGGFKSDKFKYYSESDFPESYVFSTGDLVVSMTDLSVDGDTLGSPATIPENIPGTFFLHNQRVGRVEFKETISKYFLYFLMKTEEYHWFILGSASGTSIRHTSPTSICSYVFNFPGYEMLDKFDLVVSGFMEKIKSNQTQIRTLTALRDSLLPKLMSGEVRTSVP